MTQSNSKRVEFKPPENVVPEGLAAGEDFDLVCTFRVKRSGSVCMTMMGDSKMPGYGETETRGDSRPGYGDEAKAMTESAPSTNQGGGY